MTKAGRISGHIDYGCLHLFSVFHYNARLSAFNLNHYLTGRAPSFISCCPAMVAVWQPLCLVRRADRYPYAVDAVR